MIPYILAAVGGYLIGQSRKETYADGGVVSNMSNKEKGKVFSFLDDYNLSDEAYHWWERFGYTKDEAKDIENSWAISRGYKMAKGGKVKKKWIQDALSGGKNKGALRRTAAKKGLLRGDENLSKTDLKKLQKMGGTTAKRAHLAETLRKFDEGGDV